MKRAFTMLVVIGVTALITFLWVTKNQAEERASLLDKRLAEAEGRIGMLEGDIDTANQRLAYLTEHHPSQTVPVSRQVKTSPTVPKETTGEAPEAINLTVPTSTSNTRVTTVQPFPLPVPFGAGGGMAGYRLAGASGSSLLIEGSSSFRNWWVACPFIGGSATVAPGSTFPLNELSDSEITNISVTTFVPVASLKSVDGNGNPFSDRMDRIVYEKLRGDAHPRIIFTLESLKRAGTFYNALGKLAMAGVTNSIKLRVAESEGADGKIEFSGVTHLKMSDFKIDPPSLPLSGGNVKAGDEVKVTFYWNARATTPAALA